MDFDAIWFMFPDSSIIMKLLVFISDAYKVDSIKNMTRQKQGFSPIKFNITSSEQIMLQGNNWQELLNDSEEKDQLIQMIKQYVPELCSGILPRSNPFNITSGKKNILFRLQEVKLLHGSKVDSDVFVFCKDTDVLILIVWTYSKLNITNNWYLKYDYEKFADIIKIYPYLGKTFSLNLPKHRP